MIRAHHVLVVLLPGLGCQSGGAVATVGTDSDTAANDSDGGDGAGDEEDGGDEGGDEGGDDGGGDDGGDWSPPEFDPSELPEGVPVVGIEIDPEAMERLDADPYESEDEQGVFIDPDGTRHEVDLSYRGAYALRSVMLNYDLRNWKVKLDNDDEYNNRREWNFNYEPHFRQKLSYDLFRFAGLAVPQAQHVLLELNGEYQGVYLQYEDPDNKDWLWDNFGHDDGDLYKAAYDLPGQPQCFGDLTWLGPDDKDYECHYAKKTNHKVAPGDYSVLRDFIGELADTSEEDIAAWFEESVDVDRLSSYLVVSNFIANWDSYPQRPKNYWVYEDLRALRMVFIPWDLDGTFNPSKDGTYNQMGTTAPVFYNLLDSDYSPPHSDEGTERPLVRRFMQSQAAQDAYIARYRELSQTILSEDYLLDRLDSLDAIVRTEISTTDRGRLDSALVSQRNFVQQRSATVQAELDGMP